MAAVIRTLIVCLVLCGGAMLAYWRLSSDDKQRQIDELSALNAQMQERLAARQAMIDRLSRSRRIAHVEIAGQELAPDGSVLRTELVFRELDDDGTELAHQDITLPGDVIYIDAWTIKFNYESVANGDPLFGHTLVLLRRMYSDRLAPRDGVVLDTPGAVPPAYAASEFGHFQRRLWESFWEIATDAALAKELGVRVAQGEAVYKPVRTGQRYELIADAAGGISLTPLSSAADAGAALSAVRH